MKTILSIEIEEKVDEIADGIGYLEQEEFKDRYREYCDGLFWFIGIRARAHIVVNGIMVIIRSAGLWGIESDSDRAYKKSVAQEELDQLSEMLLELGFSKDEISEQRAKVDS